jgi:signal transduction histidine kinase
MNLLNNAFKFTRRRGRVELRAYERDAHLLIEVEDQCGGLSEARADPFAAFGDRRGQDRSGLGLGLSIARKAVFAHGGDISVRNMPDTGCVFTIDIPLKMDEVSVPQMAT